ncbi:DNA primase, partial [Streptomyces nigra]
MTSSGERSETLFDFNPEAVAEQIRNQEGQTPTSAVALPAQADVFRGRGGEATAGGLLPDTLTDR